MIFGSRLLLTLGFRAENLKSHRFGGCRAGLRIGMKHHQTPIDDL